MATKTIRANVTLHLPGEGYTPATIDAVGNSSGGKYAVKEVPPGTPVKMDAAEADALIAAKVAEEYKAPKAEDAGAPSAQQPA